MQAACDAGRVLGRVGAAQMVFAPAGALPRATAEGRHLAAVRTVYPRIFPQCGEAGENRWPARIERREMLGDVVVYTIGWPGGALRVHAFPSQMLEEGTTVTLHIPPERAILVAADA